MDFNRDVFLQTHTHTTHAHNTHTHAHNTHTHTLHVLMSFGSGNFLRFYFNSQLSQFSNASSLFPPPLSPLSTTIICHKHSLPLSLTHSLTHSLALYLYSHSLSCVCVVFIQCTALPTTTRAHNASNRVSERASSTSAHSLARLRCLHSIPLSLTHTCALTLSRLHCQSHARPSVGFDQCCRAPAEQQRRRRRRRRRRATHFAVSHCAEWVLGECVWGEGVGGREGKGDITALRHSSWGSNWLVTSASCCLLLLFWLLLCVWEKERAIYTNIYIHTIYAHTHRANDVKC